MKRAFSGLIVSLLLCACGVGRYETGVIPEGFDPESVVERDSVECVPRAGLPNFYHKLESGKSEMTIAFLGGSITQQEGYRVHCIDYFRELYPQTAFEGVQAAIGGTGSQLGALRCGKDVISHHPDLVFVEFAINDGGAKPLSIRKNMEGIVRQIWSADPTTDIIFVYTVTDSKVKYLLDGHMMKSSSVMEDIADYYGIPSVDFGVEVARLVSAGKLVMKAQKNGVTQVAGPELDKKTGLDPGQDTIPVNADGTISFAPDGVHPYTDTGHRIYMQSLARSFPVIKDAGRSGARKMLPPMVDNCTEHVDRAPLTDARMKLSGPYEKYPGGNYEISWWDSWSDYWLLYPGSGIEFTFRGSQAFCYYIPGPGGAVFTVSVDGSEPVRMMNFNRYSTAYTLSYCSLCSGLDPDKEHTVVLRVTDEDFDKRGILPEASRAKFDEHPESFEIKQLVIGDIFTKGKIL